MPLKFNGIRDGQCILRFNAQIPDSIVHLGAPKQKLDSPKISSLLVDL